MEVEEEYTLKDYKTDLFALLDYTAKLYPLYVSEMIGTMYLKVKERMIDGRNTPSMDRCPSCLMGEMIYVIPFEEIIKKGMYYTFRSLRGDLKQHDGFEMRPIEKYLIEIFPLDAEGEEEIDPNNQVVTDLESYEEIMSNVQGWIEEWSSLHQDIVGK